MSSTEQIDVTMSGINPKATGETFTPSAKTSGTQEPPKKPVGRPPKRRGYSIGGGRKKKQKGEAISVSLERKMAQDIFNKILEENDALVVGRIARMFDRKKKKDEKFWEKPGESGRRKSKGKHSKESALAFFLEYGFTRKQYSALVKDTIQRNEIKKNQNIYPSYSVLKKAKRECLPSKFHSSEQEIRTPLAQLVNTTGERLCKSVASGWSEKSLKRLKLIFLGNVDILPGYTHSRGRCNYPANDCDDAQQSLIVTSVTPLQMNSESDAGSSEHFWHNPTPASYRYCRPVRIASEKTAAEAISEEYERMTAEIKELKNHKFTMKDGKKVTIALQLHLTKFDKECANHVLNGPATQRCRLCLKTTHEFGDQDLSFLIKKELQALDLGITLLHAETEIFEHLLYVSYRKNIEIPSGTQDSNDFESYRESVIKKSQELFGIRLDQVIQGHGKTNTSKLASVCFKDPQKFAQALKLDEGFVQDLADILILFKTNQRVDYDMLEDYCWRVYWDHCKLYQWAHMDVTIHELLMHGCMVARKSPLPVCYFSDDSRKAWYKFHRRNMTKHAGQCSKESQLLKVYLRAMYESDPLISNILLDKRLKVLEKKNFPKRLEKYTVKRENSDDKTSSDEDDNGSDISSSEESTTSDSDLDD